MRAMIEIGRHAGNGAIKRKEITAAQGISHGYLENILIALKSHRLIRTTRGAHGGFVLEGSPSQVTLLQIVNALEGSLAPVDCIENTEICRKSGACPARVVWKKLHDAQNAVLSGMTLQDLLDLEIQQTDAFDYVI